MAYTLSPLPYAYDALAPHISAETMQLHHDKHHATYVDKLNAALTGSEYADWDLEKLIRAYADLPENLQPAVRNHGGGHHNHTLFWEVLTPGGATAPSGILADEINKLSGDFATFQKQFSEKALSVFGSGWAWLVQLPSGAVEIITTANQDSPLLQDKKPLFGIDVWEHAYYVDYRNRRPEYVEAIWKLLNWDMIAGNLD